LTEAATHPPTPVVSPLKALEFLNRAGTVLAGSLDFDETLREVTQLAVPDIADWCAVYISGDNGAEREITSRHPDPALEALIVDIRRRRRESGASESIRVQRTLEPVLVSDVGSGYTDDIRPEERGAIDRLAARSYMIVPLVARGRVLGALTFLSTREGRHYTAGDLAFTETLAARCAIVIDNARLFDAAERSLRLLDTLFSTAPVGLAFLDAEQRYVRINDALAEMNGRSVQEHIGCTLQEVLGPSGEDLVDIHREVLRTRRPVLNHETTRPVAGGRAGDVRYLIASHTPVIAHDGQLLGVGVTVIDITERRKLLLAEQRARRRADELAQAESEARARADFLARAGSILDSSLDYGETLANVARTAVPEIADWCAVSVLDEAGDLHQVATAHVDPGQRALADEISRRYPQDPNSSTGTIAVARSGETSVIREITDEMLVAAVGDDPERLELVRRLGLRSAIIAPLTARGRVFGTITIASAESGRLFEDVDVQLAEELAHRAGVAIDNARLYTARTRIAHTLQVKLLPERLPDIPGVVLAARYRAAGELNEVGGDFYDVFARSSGEWALVVGDVSGKGAEAAAGTALARYTLRAAALEPGHASEALRRLNTAMLADDSSQFATVVLAYVSATDDGGMAARLALGGHPPPLVLRADGRVDEVGAFGSLLGIVTEPKLVDVRAVLGPGDVMLLYTDGVTEAGRRDRPLGQAGVVELLEGLAGQGPQAIVDAVEHAVVAAQPGEPRDDIAVLALGVARR
jgi:PAS domain S-box-containing protein